MAARCSFCGSNTGPFSRVEGVFAVLMCVDCLATRGHGTGPYPAMTRAEMRASLDLLPTWVLETKAAAFSVATSPAGCHPGCVCPLWPSARPRWPSAWDWAIGRG
jgi:hypothetical protein